MPWLFLIEFPSMTGEVCLPYPVLGGLLTAIAILYQSRERMVKKLDDRLDRILNKKLEEESYRHHEEEGRQ